MIQVIKRFIRDVSGATAIEYSLVAALLAIGALVAVTLLGDRVLALFQRVSDNFPA